MSMRVEKFGKAILYHSPILFGIAVIEDAYEKTCRIEALLPEEIESREPELLLESKRLMPRILFDNLDVLIVDQIGKDISGTGMDPNITYSYMRETGIDLSRRPRRIAVLDLSAKTHGAASGLGLADVTTFRVLEKMNPEKTYPNSLTVGLPQSCMIPMVMPNQKLAIQAAICMSFKENVHELLIVRIHNTLHLEEIEISEALLKEANLNPQIQVLTPAKSLDFDSNGNLF